jgi:hypothetical protein
VSNFQDLVSEGLDGLRAQSSGVVLGVFGAAAGAWFQFTARELLMLGIIGWLAGTLLAAWWLGWRRDTASVAAVGAQTATDKTEVIEQLHSFADEGTDLLQNKNVRSEEDVDRLRTSLREWKQRFLQYLDGKVLRSEYRRLQRLDTFSPPWTGWTQPRPRSHQGDDSGMGVTFARAR